MGYMPRSAEASRNHVARGPTLQLVQRKCGIPNLALRKHLNLVCLYSDGLSKACS